MEERHDDPKLTAPTLGDVLAERRHTGNERTAKRTAKADRIRMDIIMGRRRGRL